MKPAARYFAVLLVACPNLFSQLPRQTISQGGVSVAFTLSHASRMSGDVPTLRAGDNLVFRFELTDTLTGMPFSGVRPAAWLDRRGELRRGETCTQRVQRLLEGSVFSRAEIDLNTYYVLSLNDDASISVVDPLFGYGSSKLLAMVALKARGEDWALTGDGAKLFVSMPAAGQIAVIETATWKVVDNLDFGPNPRRIAIQPGGGALWASYDSGVKVIDTRTHGVRSTFSTGRGPHQLAFSDDARFAFVLNGGSGSVSVIDVRASRLLRTAATGSHPISISFSNLSQLAYISDEKDGTVTALAADDQISPVRVQLEPGLGPVRVAPGGKLAFALNTRESLVHIIDTVTNRIVQSGKVESQPDQVTFSERLAYIRHLGSETVLMIGLDSVVAGAPLQVVDFPGGQNPFGKVSTPSPADGIVQAPGENAVLIANPADRAIYFYKEGMAAPMGNFATYGREPRAVLVVDRSLSQRAPGVYETSARVHRSGEYALAFFLDSPRVLHCFDVVVEPSTTVSSSGSRTPPRVQPMAGKSDQRAGQSALVGFRLTEADGSALTGLKDVRILVYLGSGSWHIREAGRDAGHGAYVIEFVPPEAGVYHVALECPSCGLSFDKSPGSDLRVYENP